MLVRHRLAMLTIALLVAAALWGCDSGNDITQASFDPQDVQAASQAASLAGPTAGMTDEIIVGLMQGALGGPTAMTSGDALVPVHETSVYLASGIAGTCTVDSFGGVECEFGGTATVNGQSVEVTGGMSAKVATGQPTIGTAYDIDFHAVAGSAMGSSTWTCLGDLTIGTDGQPIDHDFTMTHTVTPTGGATVIVSVVDSSSRFELVVTGPLGGTVRIDLDRASMSGSVYVNTRLVATIAIDGDCTNVDYVDSRHEDFSICPQA